MIGTEAALAGVMGGADSGVTEITTDILLESAWFTPQGIRRTSRRTALSSDSSYRFERGVDSQGVLTALALAVKLILETAGGTAETLIVSARESGSMGDSNGIGFWIIAADAPGVDRRPYRLADGAVAAEITLRQVEIDPGARLPGGLESLLPVVAIANLMAAAEMLGLMSLLFDTALAYVKTRQQFGQPLGRFQVIQHRMTDAHVLVEQARSQVIRAALAAPADFARAAAGAKSYVAEAALTVAHTAVQMHGGMGITDELLVGHALKRIRVLALTFGDAAAALDRYRSAA